MPRYNGVSIPADKLKIIFDPLTRVMTEGDVVPTPSTPGLGLYITKEVVVAHGGTIEVTSSEMGGNDLYSSFSALKP